MNKRNIIWRMAALLFAAALLSGAALPVFAEQETEPAVTEEAAAETDPDTGEPIAAVEPAEGTQSDAETTDTTTDASTESVPTTSRTTMPAPDTLAMLKYEDTDDGGIRILSFRWTVEETVVIPPSINGKVVTEIGENAFNFCYADFVLLPDSIQSIGAHAFEGCAYLKEMQIPAECRSIGEAAFAECERLETVTLPDTVAEIGANAFDGTPFYENQQGEMVILGSGILCAYRGSAGELVIPDNVRIIAANACADCDSLRSVTIPAGVEAIQSGAFAGCTALSEVHAPDVIPQVAADAFTDTKWLNGGKEDFLLLGKMLYAYRGKENEIEVPEGVRVINQAAFAGNNAVTVVRAPESTEEIRAEAFADCGSLQVAEFGENLRTIGEKAFSGCNTLGYLRLGHALTEVGDYAFASCPALTEVYLPDTLETVGEKAFGYSYDEKKGWLKLKNELVLYANSVLIRDYADAAEIAHEPLPDVENTEPAPVVTTPENEAPALGRPRGTAWIPGVGLGLLLAVSGGVWYGMRRKKEQL